MSSRSHRPALPRGRGLLFVTCPAGCAVSELRAFDLEEEAHRELSKDVLGVWLAAGDHVVMARRDGSVVVAPFDLNTLTFRSEPVPLFEGVRTASTSFVRSIDLRYSVSRAKRMHSCTSRRPVPRPRAAGSTS